MKYTKRVIEMTSYTIKQLKKMATERMSKVFENVFGYCLFNPYEEREYMIVTLVGHYAVEIVEQNESLGTFEPAIVNGQIGLMVYGNKMISRIFEAIRNHGNYEPKREETKGRKSRFIFSEIMDMLISEIQGVRISDIAKYYQTSSVVIHQILTGKSYQWASGITQESF